MTSTSLPGDERLDALLARHPLPTWRVAAWSIVSLLCALIIWAGYARLEEVAIADGEVVPQGKVKVIQHLEGGIIERILVSEGSQVRSGDVLVQLNLASAGVNRKELLARLDGEQLRRARVLAESSGGALILPAAPADRQPDMAEAERRAFEARRREVAASVAVLQEQLRQKQLEIEELEARRRSTTSNLTLARERLKMSESLLAEGLTAKMEHLKLRSEVESLEGQLASLAPAVPRARAAAAEVEQRLKEAEVRFRRAAQEEVGTAEETIARLNELLAEATDQGARAEIKSPIDGIVKKLRYNTIGGVVSRGEPIMEIVPTDDRLVVIARLRPTDRGYVAVGQPAMVKISTYDFVRYGGLAGRVTHVSPDSSAEKNGVPYFEVIVETDKAHLGADTAPLPISAGMQATIDIQTGSRSVLQYLITPVLKLRHEAFRER
jgi:adhesin transport system membrane fusion protein